MRKKDIYLLLLYYSVSLSYRFYKSDVSFELLNDPKIQSWRFRDVMYLYLRYCSHVRKLGLAGEQVKGSNFVCCEINHDFRILKWIGIVEELVTSVELILTVTGGFIFIITIRNEAHFSNYDCRLIRNLKPEVTFLFTTSI